MKNSVSATTARMGATSSPGLSTPGTPLLSAFLMLACGLAAFHIYALFLDSSLRAFGAALISAAALLPTYMWCRGALSGIPIFPLYALMFILKFAYPLTGDDPIITIYGDAAGLEAALFVTAFLLTGTAAAYACQKVVRPADLTVLAMARGKGDGLLLTLIFLAGFYGLASVGWWFGDVGHIASIIRAGLFGLASVGIFVLAYRWAAGELDGFTKALFAAALGLYMVAASMSLYMVEMIADAAFAAFAYVLGGGRVPWKWSIVMLTLFVFMHSGKDQMRSEYWFDNYQAVQIYDYPWFLAEWLGYGWETLKDPPQVDDNSGSFSERMSMVPLLMKVQAETPDRRPHLYGETYAHIPALLVPRVLYPGKPTAHEGTHLLSVYYGLQTREATERTTIAWGLLTEACANFGALGVIALALLLGAAYGSVAKMAVGAPLLSLRTLVAIVFTAVAVQSDATLAVYISSLFQSLAVVLAMSLLMMERPLPAPAQISRPTSANSGRSPQRGIR